MTTQKILSKALRSISVAYILFLSISNSLAQDEQRRYRFLNNEGVPVISHNIPSEFVKNGYEIINRYGYVIKKVDPLPPAEETAAKEKNLKLTKEMLAQYQVLKRRYSSTKEIEKSKARRLKDYERNISILKTNTVNQEKLIAELINEAAQYERAGTKIPDSILASIENSKKELEIMKDLFNRRVEERENIEARFNGNIAAFKKGQAHEKSLLKL